MSGVQEEVYREKEHDPLSVKKSFGADRENLVAVGVGSGLIWVRRSVWGTRDHYSYLVMSQWDAVKEAARAVHSGIGTGTCAVG